jgi:hypothetical protein
MGHRWNTDVMVGAFGGAIVGAFFIDWWTHTQLAGQTITVEPYAWWTVLVWIVPLLFTLGSMRRG